MDLTLVIMAAGMGSRYGGLKQIEPVGPSGEIIADYSIYDAIKAGFNKIVFIIRKEHLQYFQENVIPKFKDKIEVSFAFQELDKIPSDVTLPKQRKKMLGTGHAVLCAKDKVSGPFAVINADDFYGASAFQKVADFLRNNSNENEYVNVNYPYIITASKNGKVKRGVCINVNGYITDIIECEIGQENDQIIAKSLTGDNEFIISEDQPVSMNMLGFKQSLFSLLEQEFNVFIHKEIGLKEEFLLPEILKKGIKDNIIKLKSEVTNSKWMGITYKEDLPELKNKILEMIEQGEYPVNLWS